MFALFLLAMKRRFWVGLAVVPILLVGAAFWARKIAWERMGKLFRHDIIACDSGDSIVVAVVDGQDHSGYWVRWKNSDFASCMRLVHPATFKRPFDNKKKHLEIRTNTDTLGPVDRITLDATTDQGWIDLPPPLRKWNHYQLAPEFCRLIKQTLYKQHGAELRALRVAPPK